MATRDWRDVSQAEFVRDWDEGLPYAAICERHAITRDQAIRLRDVFGCKKRMDRKLRFKPKQRPDPTESEIQEQCQRIRMAWTPREEKFRRKFVPEWHVPNLNTAGTHVPRASPVEYIWMRPIDLPDDVPTVIAEAIGRAVNYKPSKIAETDESLRVAKLIEW